MDLKAVSGLLMLTVALAGCTGGDDPGPSAEEQCAIDDRLWDGACMDHTEPSMIVDGIPEEAVAYLPYDFTWRLDNGTRPSTNNEVHSMYSGIYALQAGDALPTNETDPEATPVGTEIVLMTHQNLPVNLTGTFTWDTPASLFMWGYMRIDNENVWQQLTDVEVVVAPEGQTTTVTISLDPASGGVVHDGDDVILGLGDGIAFKNDLQFDYVINLEDCGAGTFTVTGGSTGDTVNFYAPDSCAWSGATPLSATTVDPGAIDGKIRVRAE